MSKECHFLQYSAGQFVDNQQPLQRYIFSQFLRLKLKQNKNGMKVGGTQSSNLKMEIWYFSKMSVDLQRTARRYIPDGRSHHIHYCENLNSNTQCGTPVSSNRGPVRTLLQTLICTIVIAICSCISIFIFRLSQVVATIHSVSSNRRA